MIPGLFINNNSFEDNIIDAIFYLINFITVIIFIFADLFSNEKEKKLDIFSYFNFICCY